jgi:hypothetical protein
MAPQQGLAKKSARWFTIIGLLATISTGVYKAYSSVPHTSSQKSDVVAPSISTPTIIVQPGPQQNTMQGNTVQGNTIAPVQKNIQVVPQVNNQPTLQLTQLTDTVVMVCPLPCE